ncbi:MAG TPA: trigger factor [Candidatus Saccharimonadales bacterium]
MQAQLKKISDTKVQLTLTADTETLANAKQAALAELAKEVRVQGFRPGKAPANLVEKQVSQQALQSEFLDRVMNVMYSKALDDHKLHPVAQPEVKVQKFVPFDTVEIEAIVEVIGEVKLPDYTKMKVAKKPVKVEAKEVDEVVENLRERASEKKDVDRAAKLTDQTWIDFKGTDAKTKEPIAGADGENYPLVLGSGNFIPGFEEELIGLKTNDEKTFDITFPKDYGVKDLQGRKVSFTVTINKVQEVVKPKLDEEFLKKVGPFKTLAELKADIKGQLEQEKEEQAARDYADEVLLGVTKKATVAIPESLISEQIDRLIDDQRRNLVYSGQTWQEFLKSEGVDEDGYRKKIQPDAELRVKAGLVLAEVAEKEKVTVTADDLSAQIQMLKGRYTDPKMQAELDTPEARRDIASRILSQKTVDKLVGYASAKAAKPAAK